MVYACGACGRSKACDAAVRRTAVLNSLLNHVDPGPRVKGFEGIAPLMCPCCVEDVTGTEGPALAGTYLAAAATVPHDADGLCLGGLRPLRCAHAFSRDQVVCQNE